LTTNVTQSKHSANCNLRHACRAADTPACNRICSAFIAIHGANGRGGRLSASNIPDSLRHITLLSSPVAEDQPKIYARLAEYVKTFARQFNEGPPDIKSLYLYSQSPGTGKSTTAAAVLNEYLNVHYIGSARRNRQASERPVYFLDVNEWQTDYNTFNRPRVPESVAAPAAERYYNSMSAASTVPFVVFDDIGVREATEAFRADLHSVINARVAAGLPSVYTSNVKMDDIVRIFDARIADRFREQTVEITFGGASKRGLRKTT